MARIACLHVPDLPLAALHRTEPDLRGRPLAVTDRDDPRAPILAVSEEARSLGIPAGLSVAQARAACTSLVVRRISAAQLDAAENALSDVADSFSPRVESHAAGTVFLDVDGLSTLFGAESHLATSLAARCHRVGLHAGVGIAANRVAARLAARKGDVEVVPPGEERVRLAPLPLSWLEPPEEIALTLERWGIRTLGDLARLSGESVSRRLGEIGLDLWRRARGEDSTSLEPRVRPPRFEEAVDCEYAIDSFEPLSFPLRAALERLVARLAVRALRAGDLELSLRLEDGGRDDRIVRVAAPTAEVKVLLSLVRLGIESRPPRGAVEAFSLRVVPERLRPVELDLFAPPGPAPDELDVTIARLAALTGPDRVGAPVVVDSHRPEAFSMERFEAKSSPNGNGTAPAHVSVLALRAFRPPVPVEVVCDRGRPDFIQGGGNGSGAPLHGRIVVCAGPWRLQGEWWREGPLARDYYDVEVSDGCVYRIYRDHVSGRWYAHGTYD